MIDQELVLLNYKHEGHRQPWNLHPTITLARWGLGWKHKMVMSIDAHNHLVLPLAIPLAGGDGCDVRNRGRGLELEVIGADQVRPLPSPS
jgi:hypothetical protein